MTKEQKSKIKNDITRNNEISLKNPAPFYPYRCPVCNQETHLKITYLVDMISSDIIINIATHLDIKSLENLVVVCKKWSKPILKNKVDLWIDKPIIERVEIISTVGSLKKLPDQPPSEKRKTKINAFFGEAVDEKMMMNAQGVIEKNKTKIGPNNTNSGTGKREKKPGSKSNNKKVGSIRGKE